LVPVLALASCLEMSLIFFKSDFEPWHSPMANVKVKQDSDIGQFAPFWYNKTVLATWAK
jgi:hypothetical protein